MLSGWWWGRDYPFLRGTYGRLESVQRDNRHGSLGGVGTKDGPYLYWKEGKYVYDYTPGHAGYHGLQHETILEHRAGAPYFEKVCL